MYHAHWIEDELVEYYLDLVDPMDIRCCLHSIQSLGSVVKVQMMAMRVLVGFVGFAAELHIMLFCSKKREDVMFLPELD